MYILISPDKFKGSLTASEVSNAILEGWKLSMPEVQASILPLADGGEGTLKVLTHHLGGDFVNVWVYDPLFRWTQASYGYDEATHTAFMEMAQASGLDKLSEMERNCYVTSSYGTGQMILDALQRGAKKIIIGIGGSATCDGGIGMAAALGYRFLDQDGADLLPIGKSMIDIAEIAAPDVMRSLEVVVLSDVDNLLYGKDGAAYVYGLQKGAREEEISQLDRGLFHLASVMKRDLKVAVDTLSGGGASGGLGAGLFGFLGAWIEPGAAWIAREMNLEDWVENCDIVITGEGKIDRQTLHGKVVGNLAQLAKIYGKPVIAFCGTAELDIKLQQKMGLTYVQSIIDRPMSLADATAQAYQLLRTAAFNVANILSKQF